MTKPEMTIHELIEYYQRKVNQIEYKVLKAKYNATKVSRSADLIVAQSTLFYLTNRIT